MTQSYGPKDERTCKADAKTGQLVAVLTVHAIRKWKPPIQRQLGGGGSGIPPAKRAKTEPEAQAGVAVKPFDQRPSRFKSDVTEVPLPNGLVMLFFDGEPRVAI